MVEILPGIGVGPLRLAMTSAEVAAVLGPPESVYRPEDSDYMSARQKKMFAGQSVEVRKKKNKILDLIDLIYENDRLVGVNMPGRSSNIFIAGMALDANRIALLTHIASLDGSIFIGPESYFFTTLGLSVSRARNRKDMNYVTLFVADFKKKFLDYEDYKLHEGPIIP